MSFRWSTSQKMPSGNTWRSRSSATLPRSLARLIHRRTEGNPLFMVNLVEYLLAEQFIVVDERRVALQGAHENIESASS